MTADHVTVVVNDRTQVHHGGVTHEPGASLNVPAETAQDWTKRGFVSPKTEEPAKRRSSS